MLGNVTCFAPGCPNPVIGQCVGYQAPCNQFYCQAHTTEKLCADCATKKLIDKRYDEYLNLAQKLSPMDGCATTFFILASLVVSLMVFGPLAAAAPFPILRVIIGITSTISLVAIPVFILRRRHTSERDAILQAEATHPGFQAFYAAWKAHRKAKDRAYLKSEIIGALGAGLVGAVKTGASIPYDAAKDTFKQDIENAEEAKRARIWKDEVDR